jgi:DUF438 domain-containing protein
MRYIANKPCSFNGKKYFIGEEIPADSISNPQAQEKLGIITIANGEGVVAELRATEPGAYEGVVPIVISTEEGESMSLPMTPEEIQQVVTIQQLSAENAIKAVAEVTNENILILVHAIEGRKTVKEAAKKRVDSLFTTDDETDESSNGNASTGTNTEGADT